MSLHFKQNEKREVLAVMHHQLILHLEVGNAIHCRGYFISLSLKEHWFESFAR